MPDPTAPSRASLIAGVGKVSRAASSGTYVSQDESEFTIRLAEKLSGVRIGGQVIDQRWLEYVAQLTFNPDGRFTAPALLLFWNDFNNLLPGASIFGTTDVNTVVTGSDGDVHTIYASAVTGMPSIRLHPDRGAIGPCTISGIVGSAKNFTSSSAFYERTSGGTYTDSTWVSSDVLRQQYSAAYGAVGGLADFQMQDGWTIDFRLTVNPIVVQGVTRDMKFGGLEVMARGIPVGSTTAQILTALKADAASAGSPGRSLFSAAQSLVITGADGTAHVTIPKATIYTGEFAFSGAKLRIGEVAFYACRNYSSGAQQALYTIA
jgi:hypothetical protein